MAHTTLSWDLPTSPGPLHQPSFPPKAQPPPPGGSLPCSLNDTSFSTLLLLKLRLKSKMKVANFFPSFFFFLIRKSERSAAVVNLQKQSRLPPPSHPFPRPPRALHRTQAQRWGSPPHPQPRHRGAGVRAGVSLRRERESCGGRPLAAAPSGRALPAIWIRLARSAVGLSLISSNQ